MDTFLVRWQPQGIPKEWYMENEDGSLTEVSMKEEMGGDARVITSKYGVVSIDELNRLRNEEEKKIKVFMYSPPTKNTFYEKESDEQILDTLSQFLMCPSRENTKELVMVECLRRIFQDRVRSNILREAELSKKVD